jgi:hypothetical protein
MSEACRRNSSCHASLTILTPHASQASHTTQADSLALSLHVPVPLLEKVRQSIERTMLKKLRITTNL